VVTAHAKDLSKMKSKRRKLHTAGAIRRKAASDMKKLI